MKPTATDDRQIEEIFAKVQFHIVGPNRNQNELLVAYLEEKLGSPSYE